MVKILDIQNTLLNKFLSELRDVAIQKDSMRFRRNIERVGEIAAYEVSKTLAYNKRAVTTPLGEADINLIDDKVVVATILRAGLPLHQGLLNWFDDAENAFVSAYRYTDDNGELGIKVEYISTPPLEGKILILADPMLATGGSLVAAYDALRAKGGEPKHTHLVSVLGCPEGVQYVTGHTDPAKCTLWCATVDKYLNEHKYIVPGLGDAGDLCYGEKL